MVVDMTPVVQQIQESQDEHESTTDEDLCPVCGNKYLETVEVGQFTIEPGDLESRHCFIAVPIARIIIIEHGTQTDEEEQVEEREAVEIEVE
jgi:hypothetical protein